MQAVTKSYANGLSESILKEKELSVVDVAVFEQVNDT